MKPKIALLADKPGWAYDRAAQALARVLAHRFTFEILHVADRPARPDCDLLHVFFWGETWHQRWGLPPSRVVKEISSHRWNQEAWGNLTPPEFATQHLHDAATLTVTSDRLRRIVAPVRPVHWTPNGAGGPAACAQRTGPITFGWAGNADDPCKGLRDVLVPAAGDDFRVLCAGGALSERAMAAFYDAIDVLLVASTAEGEPLTLLEAMAHGCAVIATDVGIVPELVRDGDNGWLVERSPAAFRAAMQRAFLDPERVRAAGAHNFALARRARTWEAVAPHWTRAWCAALGMPDPTADPSDLAAYNNGIALGQWPQRARRAAALVADLRLAPGARVLDLGCGQQTVRTLLPDAVDYRPFDRLQRTADTRLLDLAWQTPAEGGEAALVLGVLEYLDAPAGLLAWLARSCRHLVVSFCDCADAERRARQHWVCRWSHAELERTLAGLGGTVRPVEEIAGGERLYRVDFARGTELRTSGMSAAGQVLGPLGSTAVLDGSPSNGRGAACGEGVVPDGGASQPTPTVSAPHASRGEPAAAADDSRAALRAARTGTGRNDHSPERAARLHDTQRCHTTDDRVFAAPAPTSSEPRQPSRPLALFTAAVAGDNSGDALIEHAIRTLLPGYAFERFPLVQKPTDADLERANACALGIVCGTNLYQHVFACGLDLQALQRLRIPLVPIGIGGSSALGGTIRMDDAGSAAVRELHARCAIGSVRDPQAFEFVHGLGVRNVELTGCPVLFSGIEPPRFQPRAGRTTLSLRARLLHVEDQLAGPATELMRALCAAERPILVLQSPYDVPLARALTAAYGLDVVADPAWQEGALLAALPHTNRTLGLRLHWNMLCLSRGIHAVPIGTDTRTSSFCAMLGVPFVPLRGARSDDLLAALHGGGDYGRFTARWTMLQRNMQRVLAQNGLQTAWDRRAVEVAAS